MMRVSKVLPDGSVQESEALELDACLRCQFFWFDPGEFEEMPQAIPEQSLSPTLTTSELPAAARLALVKARMESIEKNTNMGPNVPDGLLDLLAGVLLLPVETEDEDPGLAKIPVVTALLSLGIVVVAALMGFASTAASLAMDWGFTPADPWRLGGATALTAFFLHVGWFHLFGNLYFLISFGDNVEDILGPVRFLALWFVATFLSSMVYILVDLPSGAVVLGASGGVSAVLVTYILFFPRAKLGVLFFLQWLIRFPSWTFLGLWVVLQFIGAYYELFGEGSNIAYVAHLSGVAVGVGAWLLWKDRVR